MSVFPRGIKGCGESANMSLYSSQLEDGYSQTKWVAEQLVMKAMAAGLPTAIYRLGK